MQTIQKFQENPHITVDSYDFGEFLADLIEAQEVPIGFGFVPLVELDLQVDGVLSADDYPQTIMTELGFAEVGMRSVSAFGVFYQIYLFKKGDLKVAILAIIDSDEVRNEMEMEDFE